MHSKPTTWTIRVDSIKYVMCVCVSVFHNFYPFLEILSEAVAFECALISSSETNNFPWKSGGTLFSKDIFHTQFHMNKWYQNPIGLIGCRIGTLGCKVHCFGIEFPSHCIAFIGFWWFPQCKWTERLNECDLVFWHYDNWKCACDGFLFSSLKWHYNQIN